MSIPSALRPNVRNQRYISVGARIRPMSETEKALAGGTSCLTVDQVTGATALVVEDPQNPGSEPTKFPLHFVLNSTSPASDVTKLGPFVDQEGLMEAIGKNALHHLLDGDDVLLVAYGHQESGKHKTLLGSWVSDEGRGLLPRISAELIKLLEDERKSFMETQISAETNASRENEAADAADAEDAAAAQQNEQNSQKQPAATTYRLAVRAFEVHNNTINDLLVPREYWPKNGHSLKALPDNSGWFAPDLLWQSVDTLQEVEMLVKRAEGNQTKKHVTQEVGAVSTPRSHAMFQLLFEKLYHDGGKEVRVREAALTFALLAPFDENTHGANATATAADTRAVSVKNHAASALHHELQCFARVLHLAAKGVPSEEIGYNSCKLTQLLQHAIDKSFTTVIGCVSPATAERVHTLHTLKFLNQLMETPVALAPQKKTQSANSAAATSVEVQQLKRKAAQLESELAQLKKRIAELEGKK